MTTASIDIVKNALLAPAGLTESHLEQILGSVLGHRIDAADIYLQAIRQESWILEEGIIKDAGHGIERGVGVRAMAGEKTGFAYSDDIILGALTQAANTARSIARQGHEGQVQAWSRVKTPALYGAADPLASLSSQEKVDLLKRIDTYARSLDPRVQDVVASLSACHEMVLILNSEGHLAHDIRPMVRFNISVVVEENGRRERASSGGGGRTDYQIFLENESALEYAREAVREALVNLEAIEAPAGAMPVVLGAGWPGILLHEAIGHGLEGDFNRKQSSAFTGRIGERVAAPGCTVVDDGTLAGRRGSLSVDDEGTPSQCTVLIEDGILKNYLQDNLNARLMGTKSTGNGRRESYASLTLPRMTNTYLLNGKFHPQEIIASVDKGIYAVNFSGGQVDITSGKFVFCASEAYLIENGQITHPIKGATLIGNGPDVLTKISMLGNDLSLDKGIGVCGKEGQSVPVGVGQPTLKIEGLTVGGTA